MNELNCCREIDCEHESQSQIASGKLCNLKPPGSFAGFECFFRSLKERCVTFQGDKHRVKEWIIGNKTTKHRPARRRFPTNKVKVKGIDDTWQMDLMDLCSYGANNRGYNWVLVCKNVFSKFEWILLLKKAANPVTAAFRQII